MVLGVVFIAVVGLSWRMVSLNLVQRDFLVKENSARTVRHINIPAYRGVIKDRNGQPLAISTPVDSVWMNPQVFQPNDIELTQLAALLAMPVTQISDKIAKYPERQFLYLKRRIPPSVSDAIKELNLNGVHFQREYRRYYPTGAVAAHVVGFNNIDDKGQEGLELEYDQSLRGIPGKKQVIKDRLGQIVEEVAIISEPQQGKDLQLTIDNRIQYIAYQALSEALVKHQATSGSVVVVHAKTGEVLAMTNLPSYNPNKRPSNNNGQYRNRALTDFFEPGSTLKVFTLLNALASGKYHRDSEIDTRPGYLVLNGRTIRDDHYLGVITLQEALQKSSNVGMARVTLSLPQQSLWTLLNLMGFGQSTGIRFPGETAGQLPKKSKWRDIELATLSYGYGVAVTVAQLARAYAAIASGGQLRPLTLVKSSDDPVETIVDPNLTHEMLALMETVVQPNARGKRAQIKGFRVAGKTGTAFLLGPEGYEKDRYVASFVGVAPASDPELVVAVVVFDPKAQGYYGSQVAAPVFAKVMAGGLRFLNITPDRVSSDTKI